MAAPAWFERLTGILHRLGGTDLFLNGPGSSYVFHPKAGYLPITGPFASSQEMEVALQDWAWSQDERLDTLKPWAGGEVRGLYRWHGMIPPAAGDGPIFTLRHHGGLSQDGFLLPEAQDPGFYQKIESLMKEGSHILICGETGSGKTTLLSYLLGTYARDERIIVIEDVKELPLQSPLWLKLAVRGPAPDGTGEIPFSRLISESLRLRGDRVVCGEIRSLESVQFLELLYTGQRGSMSTFHGDGVLGTRARLLRLCEEAGFSSLLSQIEGRLWGIFLKRGMPPTVSSVELIF